MKKSELTDLYTTLIESFFDESASRKEIGTKIRDLVAIDNQGADSSLLSNCEQSLRHIDEEGYYTTKNELLFLLRCLKGEKEFSENALSKATNT